MRLCGGEGCCYRCSSDLGRLTCCREIATFVRLIAHVGTIGETVADTCLVHALA